MAIAHALVEVLVARGVFSGTEMRSILDNAQRHLEEKTPNHPGQRGAVAILEGMIRGDLTR